MIKKLFSISSYILLGIAFILAVLVSIGFFKKDISAKDMTYEHLALDQYGIAILDDNIGTENDYFIIQIATYEGYHIYLNTYNQFASLFLDGENFNVLFFERIINGEITSFDDKYPITIYLIENIPIFINNDINIEIINDGSIADPYYTNMADFLLSFAILFFISTFIFKQLIADMKKLKYDGFRFLLYSFVGFLIIYLIDSLVIKLSDVLSLSIVSENQLLIERSLFSNGYLFAIISSVILAPILEEIVFRKLLSNVIKNDKIFLIVSSLIFGLLHILLEKNIMQALIYSISYISSGLIFGLLYLKSDKNVFIPIAAHILNNLIAILIIFS